MHIASGSGMKINCIGQSAICAPSCPLHLNHVLHVPAATKNLVSVSRLTSDNCVSLEYFPKFFVIKDLDTRKVILSAECRGGLYPFPSVDSSSGKCVLSAIKPSLERWHNRFGHPSLVIVNKVLHQRNLDFVKESSKEVCDACQLGKSHQLPFSKSTSVSSSPLELIFSDVWGQAPSSIGNKSYYVSFIDDFSKFSWIYLLKYKSEVFDTFLMFQ